MREDSKEFENTEGFRNANKALTEYQRRHNILRKDYECLLKITSEHIDDQVKFDSLYRASLRSLLSLIESDIYGLNQIDNYPSYTDKHSFEDKFKKTFKQVCKTWNKSEMVKIYLDSEYSLLKDLKQKRDRLIHPKNTHDIPSASKSELAELVKVFENYKKMLHSIMDGFFISVKINDISDIKKLF